MPITIGRPTDAEAIRAGRRAVVASLIVVGAFVHTGAVLVTLAIVGSLDGSRAGAGLWLWDAVTIVALVQGLLAAGLALLVVYRHRWARVAYWSWTTSLLLLTALLVAKPGPSARTVVAVLIVLSVVAAVGYGVRVRLSRAG
jgi:hypothetical protein